MRERQRALGAEGDAVIEGRDIGTVVAPDAAVKVYLVADSTERARAPRCAERPGIGADALATDLRAPRRARRATTCGPPPDAVEIDTTTLDADEVVDRIEALVRRAAAGVNRADAVWGVGRFTLQPIVKLVVPLRVYGIERVPRNGGVVLAFNHFSWIDPPAFGAACPRTIHYMAKIEAHRVPGLGQLIRAFGTFSVRRGESDREAVRHMRQIVQTGDALGLFVEGTRQRSGVPGEVQPGAAMVAIQEGVPVVPAAIHGSQAWSIGNWQPVSIAWGEPMRSTACRAGGKGYREARRRSSGDLRLLWDWLVELHALGRPRGATPPA